jgi:hypothetical protein
MGRTGKQAKRARIGERRAVAVMYRALVARGMGDAWALAHDYVREHGVVMTMVDASEFARAAR